MKSSVIGILVAMLGVVVALCAWLFQFQPIRPSPFDKIPNVSTPLPVERDSRPENEAPRRYESQAVINDPDGYTNLRSGPGIQYQVVSKVVNGEIFYVIYQQGNWWQVRTREGKSGYMHRSRIKIL